MTVRLDLWSKNMPILNKIPTYKWISNNNYWRRMLKNERKVRLVVKKYANSKQNTYIEMEIQQQ